MLCENGGVNDANPATAPEKLPVAGWHVPRLVIAWAAALVMGVLVTVLASGEDRYNWLVLAVGVSTLVTFALQLGTAQRVGFITRVAYSVAGSVVIIVVIDVVGLLLGR